MSANLDLVPLTISEFLMSRHHRPIDESALMDYLTGKLSPERVEEVQAWLDADPSRAARVARLRPSDPLIDAVGGLLAGEPGPTDTVERIVRRVNREMGDGSRAAVVLPAETAAARPRTSVGGLPPTDSPIWLPSKLGDYRVGRELGKGGMGYVFEGTDERLGRRVALKVLHPDLARESKPRARFLREAQAAAQVEHDNIVPILHCGEERGVFYIAMPLLKGETLADRLERDGRLSPRATMRVGRDVASGLAAAHDAGLVHRDIKPQNIWLDEATHKARVLDFGVARFVNRETLTNPGEVSGTPTYMAPEQAQGARGTAQADLFSLGAVLYECATGKRAFQGTSAQSVMRAVVETEPPTPAEVNPDAPPALCDLIVWLLKKNPDDRPRTAWAVAEGLHTLRKESDGAVPDSTAVPTPPDVRRPSRSLLYSVLGTVAAAVLVGVVLGLASRPDHSLAEPDRSVAAQPPVDPPDPIHIVPSEYRRREFALQVEMLGGEKGNGGICILRRGDRIQFEVTPDKDCHVAIWSINADGSASQLFPNREEDEDRCKAGKPRRIPKTELWAEPSAGIDYAWVLASARPWEIEAADKQGAGLAFFQQTRAKQLAKLAGRSIQLRPPQFSEDYISYRVLPKK